MSFPLTEHASDLSDSVALITGGTSGIGLEIARRLRAEGSRVVITGRNVERGVAAESELGPEAIFIAADAGEPGDVERSVTATLARFGRIDVLINNAGIALTERLVDTAPADFDRVMAANVRGPYLYARACFAALVRSRGCMVHIGSDAGLRAEQAIGAYSISKAALVMMSNVLALDGAQHGVRSNCVCPGATAPGMLHSGPASDPDRGEDDPATWPVAPLGRVGQTRDVADAVVYLAGPAASFVSGAVLLIDGGTGAGLLA